MVAALADKRDNPKLVEKLMNKISDVFQEKYSSSLNDMIYVDINIFQGFEEVIDTILFPKVHSRGVGSTIFGTFVTSALTIGALLVLIQLPTLIPNLNIGLVANLPFLIFLACIPGLLVGAIAAGTRKYALIANIIGILPIVIYFAYFTIKSDLDAEDFIPYLDIPVVILMAEQFIVVALLCAILGGTIIENKRLFPFTKQIERNITEQPTTNEFSLEPKQEQSQLEGGDQDTQLYPKQYYDNPSQNPQLGQQYLGYQENPSTTNHPHSWNSEEKTDE